MVITSGFSFAMDALQQFPNSGRSCSASAGEYRYTADFGTVTGIWLDLTSGRRLFPMHLPLLVVLLFTGGLGESVHANDVSTPPLPSGEVLLIVSGNLTRPNVGDEVHLDRSAINSFDSITIPYTTSGSGEKSLLEGFRLSDLLAAVGSDSSRVRAIAADDYHAVIENIDLQRYPVLIAYRENDRDLTLRTLGPLRIVFPFDDYPEIDNDVNRAASVWQLTHLELL